jgi:hypothetical protein
MFKQEVPFYHPEIGSFCGITLYRRGIPIIKAMVNGVWMLRAAVYVLKKPNYIKYI